MGEAGGPMWWGSAIACGAALGLLMCYLSMPKRK